MIDTHQHLIYPRQFRYPWTDNLPALQGEFCLQEYHSAAQGCGITGTVFMEVDVAQEQSLSEAQFFCRLSEDPSNRILGVIAAGRPENADFESHLDALAHPKLVGIRRVLHTQPDELSASETFRRNIRALGERGLPFDLCVLQRQLGMALDLVRACPDTIFILDHCGVPDIAGNDAPQGAGFHQWEQDVRSLAAEENVHCKISGITVYAGGAQRSTEGLRPYTDTVIEAFGPCRCLWGGDWPVVNLACDLADWVTLSRELIPSQLNKQEVDAIFSENSRRIYRLTP